LAPGWQRETKRGVRRIEGHGQGGKEPSALGDSEIKVSKQTTFESSLA
jgi:hypothetical protein